MRAADVWGACYHEPAPVRRAPAPVKLPSLRGLFSRAQRVTMAGQLLDAREGEDVVLRPETGVTYRIQAGGRSAFLAACGKDAVSVASAARGERKAVAA